MTHLHCLCGNKVSHSLAAGQKPNHASKDGGGGGAEKLLIASDIISTLLYTIMGHFAAFHSSTGVKLVNASTK